jgi:hypothetical protein
MSSIDRRYELSISEALQLACRDTRVGSTDVPPTGRADSASLAWTSIAIFAAASRSAYRSLRTSRPPRPKHT